ncbi:MAG: hypothetical protein ABSH51_28650 [Solirubrobacteraceae bacterium]|jgi:hypothetical protein
MSNPDPTLAPLGYRDDRGVVHLVQVRKTPDGAWQVLDVRVIDTLIEGRDAAEAVARDYATEHHHPPRPAAGHRRQDDRAAA